jgi:hypothetical protein
MLQRWGRDPAVIAVAATMGLLGFVALFGTVPTVADFNSWITHLVMAGMVLLSSILLWTGLAALLGRRSLVTWGAVGLASPVLGGLMLAPPVSFLVLFGQPLVTFPIGLATGVLVGGTLRIGSTARKVR